MLFFVKVIVGGLLIAIVSEVSKLNETIATMIVSMPIISIITYTIIYLEQRDIGKVARMSDEMIYLLVPSFAFFVMLPVLLTKLGNFWLAIGISALATSVFYYFTVKFLGGNS